MTSRLPIQLRPEEAQALRVWASHEGLSLSTVVRRLIRENLLRAHPGRAQVTKFLKAAAAVVGGPRRETTSRDHDRILYGRRFVSSIFVPPQVPE